MAFSKDFLLTALSYDTEEVPYLSFEQRCTIHKEIGRQLQGFPPYDFEETLQTKLIQKLVEIQEVKWIRPLFRIYDDEGTIKRERLN